jgi:SAM-dependent methyltransferase
MSTEHSLSAPTYAPVMAEAQNYMRWVLDQFRGELGKSVLEVGIGHGGYSAHMPPDTQYWGLDIDPEIVANARANFPHRDFFCADITAADFPDRLGHLAPDSILCANVIEHIEDDRLAVTNLLHILKPGGRLLLLVPAIPALYNDLDRLAGHFRRYTRSRLTAAIPLEICTIKRMHFFNSIGALGWYANKLKRHDSIENANVSAQVRFFDRYVLPISKAADRLLAGSFGQSLIAVVRKS